MPIVLKYALMDERLHLGLGPQFAFLTSANDTYSGVVNNRISVEEDIKESSNSTDAGLVFHVEYKIRGRYGAGIANRFYLGLTDAIQNVGEAAQNRVFSILATIPIGGDPTEKDQPDGDTK